MQTSTLVVLACLVAMVAAAQYEVHPAVDSLQTVHDTPVHERSPRTKRGLLLLKKKLLLGALGLKAAKVGAVGVVGALALKSKGHGPKHHVHAPQVAIKSHGPKHHAPQVTIKSHDHHHHQLHHFDGPAHSHVEVHDWSG